MLEDSHSRRKKIVNAHTGFHRSRYLAAEEFSRARKDPERRRCQFLLDGALNDTPNPLRAGETESPSRPVEFFFVSAPR